MAFENCEVLVYELNLSDPNSALLKKRVGLTINNKKVLEAK